MGAQLSNLLINRCTLLPVRLDHMQIWLGLLGTPGRSSAQANQIIVMSCFKADKSVDKAIIFPLFSAFRSLKHHWLLCGPIVPSVNLWLHLSNVSFSASHICPLEANSLTCRVTTTMNMASAMVQTTFVGSHLLWVSSVRHFCCNCRSNSLSSFVKFSSLHACSAAVLELEINRQT